VPMARRDKRVRHWANILRMLHNSVNHESYQRPE
jgi:hypothetical protein